MTDKKAIKILERRTTIPDDETSWDDINKAIDIAIAAIHAKQGILSINFSQISDKDIQLIKDRMKNTPIQVFDNTICPPPNDPLTLEELRLMDGEPVWVQEIKEPRKGEWRIIKKPWYDIGLCLDSCGMLECEDMGKVWLAYRRKPDTPLYQKEAT